MRNPKDKRPKKQKSPTKKTTVASLPKTNSDLSSPRQLRPLSYKSFKLTKRIKHPGQPLSSGIKLFWRAVQHFWSHKKIFLLASVIYIILTLMLVKGLNLGADGANAKTFWQNLFTGGNKSLSTGFTFFGYLLGSSSKTSSDVANLYQTVLMVVMSLVFIWILRQTYANKKPTLKEVFYKSQYPLIQFILVAGVIIIQLLPLLISGALYSYIFGNGLAVGAVEKTLWIAMFFMMSLLSFYWIASSIFALYIVTLPDVEPLQALRSARQLVRYRRWTVMRKVLFLPLALVLVMLVVGLPVIILITAAAPWLFFIMGMFGLLAVHTYLYGLYRELL